MSAKKKTRIAEARLICTSRCHLATPWAVSWARVGLESNESNYVQKSIANLQVQTERIELRAKIHIWLTFGDVRPMGSNPWVEPWDKSGLRPQKSAKFVASGHKFRLHFLKGRTHRSNPWVEPMGRIERIEFVCEPDELRIASLVGKPCGRDFLTPLSLGKS